MEKIKFSFLSFIFMVGMVGVQCTSQTNNEMKSSTAVTTDSTFDQAMAKTLGADEYGMRKYVMALLKSGPNRDQDSTRAVELQRAHMNNINRLAEEGKLVLAGPFLDGGSLRGIYVFDVETIEEARELTESDPAIQAGRLKMELHPWYGSAAIKKVNSIHTHISKKNP